MNKELTLEDILDMWTRRAALNVVTASYESRFPQRAWLPETTEFPHKKDA